jgi:hypothetical protein
MQTKQEIKSNWLNNNRELEFFCTCCACPEQYDILCNDIIIGYIRLRWGILYCEIPFNGQTVYETYMDDNYKGCFDDEIERHFHLENIKKNIINYLESDDEKNYDEDEN